MTARTGTSLTISFIGIVRTVNTVKIKKEFCSESEHGTTIGIKDVTKKIDAARTKGKIIQLLESMYRRDLNSGKVTVPREYKRKLMQEIYYCQKYGVDNHLTYIKCEKAFYKEHLYGKAYYINMIEPKSAKKVLDELGKINWEY